MTSMTALLTVIKAQDLIFVSFRQREVKKEKTGSSDSLIYAAMIPLDSQSRASCDAGPLLCIDGSIERA